MSWRGGLKRARPRIGRALSASRIRPRPSSLLRNPGFLFRTLHRVDGPHPGSHSASRIPADYLPRMASTLLLVHSYFRWLVLLAGLIAVPRDAPGHTRQ